MGGMTMIMMETYVWIWIQYWVWEMIMACWDVRLLRSGRKIIVIYTAQKVCIQSIALFRV